MRDATHCHGEQTPGYYRFVLEERAAPLPGTEQRDGWTVLPTHLQHSLFTEQE